MFLPFTGVSFHKEEILTTSYFWIQQALSSKECLNIVDTIGISSYLARIEHN